MCQALFYKNVDILLTPPYDTCVKTDADNEFRHGIRTVCRESGVSPDLLRAWEKRYEVVLPRRTQTNRRIYSDEQIVRLSLVRRAVACGMGIGEAARMPSGSLEELVSRWSRQSAPDLAGSASEPPGPRAERASVHEAGCLDAVIRIDGSLLRHRFRAAALDLSRQELLEDVVAPLMKEIGQRWHEGELSICQEHLASAQVRALLAELLSSDSGALAGPEIVVTTPSEQRHEIGAMMAALVAAEERWCVTWLGADVPAEEIALAATRRNAKALALSLIHPSGDPGVSAELRRLAGLLPRGVAVLAGGLAAESYRDALSSLGAEIHPGLDSLRSSLRRMRP